MTDLPEKEYRYPRRGFWNALAILAMGVAAALLPTFVRGIGWYVVAVYVLVVPGVAYLLVWSHFWGRRGLVRVGEGGVTVRDWLNEEVTIGFDEIKELHQLTGLWQINAHAPSLRIVVQTDVGLRLGPKLVDLALLREDIIARAGLTKTERKSWGTRYTRPMEEGK